MTCKTCSNKVIENKTTGLCATCSHAERKSERDSLKVKKIIPLKKIAPKMMVKLKEYSKVRAEYLSNHQLCESKLTGCTGMANEIHHKKGRIGSLLTDPNYFLAVCPRCHKYLTEHPAEALKMGFSIQRL